MHTGALPELEEKPLALPLQLTVVARLAPNKRVDQAIQVVQHLRTQQLDARLTIVGTGVMEQSLRGLVRDLELQDHVHFRGGLSEREKDEVLRRSHWLLHTSVREGWGLNVIEANAMGTPAAVYPVPGLIESTLHDVTGIVAKEETPAALADALVTLLKQPQRYEQYRRQAWDRAKTFHWDAILPAACDWLERMAGAPKPDARANLTPSK